LKKGTPAIVYFDTDDPDTSRWAYLTNVSNQRCLVGSFVTPSKNGNSKK
jgi:hypothetical protein